MTLLEEITLKVPPEILATRDAHAIADALNAGRVRKQKTDVGQGLILETLGFAAGNALMDALSSIPDFRYVWPLIAAGKLDISTPLVAGALAQFVAANVVTQAGADALMALAEVPDPLTEFDVRAALWADNGDYLA